MSYHTFSYLPLKRKTGTLRSPLTVTTATVSSTSDAAQGSTTTSPTGRFADRYPIRVTPSALEDLIYAIVYSVEFQAPVEPHPPFKYLGTSAGANSSGAAGGDTVTGMISTLTIFFGRVPVATSAGAVGSSSRLSPRQEQEHATQQRLCAQACVTPVTQVVHKLGGIHIVVRRQHSNTVGPAKQKAVMDARRLIVEDLQGPSRTVGVAGGISGASAHSSRCSTSPTRDDLPFHHMNSGATAAPLSPSPSSGRGGACGTAGSSVNQLLPPPVPSTSSLFSAGGPPSSSPSPGLYSASLFMAGPEEVGMELTVRLVAKESGAWSGTRLRPIAELIFPIIRTNNEDTTLYMGRGGSGELTSATMVATSASRTSGVMQPAAHSDLIFVNDPQQVQDALLFITNCFYDAISMETFLDFTNGELQFDAQIKRKRSFL